MQKRQPMRQPACELTHTVLRSSSGIITASTIDSSMPSGRRQATGKRYFAVPSEERALPAGAAVPRSKLSASLSLAALEIFTILSQERTLFTYSQSASCLPTKGFRPQPAAASRSSSRLFPKSFSFIRHRFICTEDKIRNCFEILQTVPIFVLIWRSAPQTIEKLIIY